MFRRELRSVGSPTAVLDDEKRRVSCLPGPPPGAQHRLLRRPKILDPVFIPASIVIFALLLFTVVLSLTTGGALEETTGQISAAISEGVGWWYVITVTIFLAFAIYFAVLRIGRIMLRCDDEQLECGVLFLVPHALRLLHGHGNWLGVLQHRGVAEPFHHPSRRHRGGIERRRP